MRYRIEKSVFLLVLILPLTGFAADPARLTLARIFEDEAFEVESFGPVRWLENGSGFTTLEASAESDEVKEIVRYELPTGSRSVLVAASSLVPEGHEKPLAIEDYGWSNDGRRLLVFTNTVKVWRRNTRGDYWLLDIGSGRLQQLGGGAEVSSMMFAKLSPDGTRVAWVDFFEKDLFVQDLGTLEVTRLTDDKGEHIINGTSDWVYEEEFDLRDGFRWSSDGNSIAYWQFDSEGVGIFHLINNTDTLYPELTSFAHPKVGTTNSACRIGVIPAGGGDTIWFEPEGDPRDHYIPKMGWIEGTNEVWLIQLNRLQNFAQVMAGDPDTGALRIIYGSGNETWVDMRHDDPVWIDNGNWYTWFFERDGWQHLHLVSGLGNTRRMIVTGGDHDVIELVHVDQVNGWAYVMASPDDPTSRYLYRTRLDGSGELERITPSLPGTHEYDISEDGQWAVHTYSARDHVPRTDLVALPDHSVRTVLEDNTEARSAFEAVDKAPIKTFRVAINDTIEVDGWLITPPDFDPSKSYPMLLYVYGEPGGQTVQNRWGRASGMWHLYLAQQGYIVASLDSRGTRAPRGREWRKSIYRRIGILPSVDLAAGVEAMFGEFPFVDGARIGVWGWSGGGSMTLNLLFRYPAIFSMGISVAPVPDQTLYDTIYQERYMGLPDDNADGYADGSPITHAHKLEGDLLLIHGTGDDNVHYQGSERLINELVTHGKLFQMMAYPNRSHSIKEGDGTRLHVYSTMTRFLEEHLEAGPKSIPAPQQPEATSFLGEPLYPLAPSAEGLAKYDEARKTWQAAPTDVDAIIWYGRRTAYLGRYRDAIRIYSDGIELHPEDARLYRHRGHRFISTRKRAPRTRSSRTACPTRSASRFRPSTPTSGTTSDSPTISKGTIREPSRRMHSGPLLQPTTTCWFRPRTGAT
jgi:dipeptidyl-peptidase-4